MARTASICAAILVQILAGCAVPGFEHGSPVGDVPLPKAGDAIEYQLGTNETIVYGVLAAPPAYASAHEDDDFSVTSVQESSSVFGQTARHDFIVDPSTNRVRFAINHCPVQFNGTCIDRYLHIDYSQSGRPWAMGSSLFQGRTLAEGAVFHQTFAVNHVAINVSYEVTEAVRTDEGTRFHVRGTPDVPFAAGFFHGEWEVGTWTPYVLSYKVQTVFAIDDLGVSNRTFAAELVDFIAGPGDTIAVSPADAPFDTRRSDRPEPTASYPPTTDVGWDGYSFADAWTALTDLNAQVRSDSERPDFRLLSMQAPTRVEETVVAGVESRLVTSTFEYANGPDTKKWSVVWNCTRLFHADASVSCEYEEPSRQEDGEILPAERVYTPRVPFQEAWHTANETGFNWTGFSVVTTSNMVADPPWRENYHHYKFSFRVLTDAGEDTSVVGQVTVDSQSGDLASTFIDLGNDR